MRASDPIFFASGAAALVYQVVWARLLARVLGSDALGSALVLAVFMGGMALGAEWAARSAGASRRPERTYALLLTTIGAWAVISPWLLGAIGPVEGLFPRAATAALLLAVPTLAMGATFPFMGRLVLGRGASLGSDTASFYGANTLGAATGALSAAFLLLPAFGFRGTLMVAALLDMGAAFAAWRFLSAPVATDAPPPTSPAPVTTKIPLRILVAPMFLGASSLALEVVLTRVLITVTGASVYAFALVLAVFLAGLGLGARQGVEWLARGNGERVLAWSAWAAVLGALVGVGLLAWRLGERDVFGHLSNRMPLGVGTLRLWLMHALFAGFALLPAAFAFGLALPAAIAAALGQGTTGARREVILGRLYALNTAGATVGALTAGFVLLPRLGAHHGLAVALAPAVLAALFLPHPKLAARLGLLVLAALLWFALDGDDKHDPSRRVLFAASGPVSNASVEEFGAGERAIRALRVDGKIVATTAPVDRRLQVVLGALPAWLADEPKRAVVVGLGTGMTAGALLHFDALEHMDVVELSSAVARASRSFDGWNRNLFEDSRTHLDLSDGRHRLALTADGEYDIVTSDPIHPWTRGSSDLYALEHFRHMARVLSAHGVASQWLPLYQLSREDVATVVSTWTRAFPHTAAWLTAYDLALIGSHVPLPSDLDRRPLPSSLAAELATLGIPGPVELAALQVADDAALRSFARDAEPMWEDHPVLEFRAPKSFLAGYATEVLAWAGRTEALNIVPEASRPAAREVQALLAQFLTDLPQGLSNAAERFGDALVARGRSR
jgi:spermidine synthase